MPWMSFTGLSKANDKYVLNRELSSAPPIPIILFFGRLVAFNAKYVIVSIGFETTTIIELGEYFNIFSETFFTIPALIPINSSRVIPGFLGTPEVITTTLLPAVAE